MNTAVAPNSPAKPRTDPYIPPLSLSTPLPPASTANKDDGVEPQSKDELTILGTGMNQPELAANPVIRAYRVQDLNEDLDVRLPWDECVRLDALTPRRASSALTT